MKGKPNGPAIAVSGLVKSYGAERPNAVDSLTFEVPRGAVVGLLGPNGAGKTTTVKAILGLVLPTAGTVRLAGYDVASQRRRALREAGAVLEGARNVYWRLSPRDNLAYFGALRGLRGQTLAERIEEVLTLLGLADRADEETRHLSRGMQQKVALAVALLHDPDVLLLDEPTLGLDVGTARTVERTVRELVAGGRRAVLLTTHQMALAERVCDRVLVMNGGRALAEGATREVIARFGDRRERVEIALGSPVDGEVLARAQQAFPGLSVVAEGTTTRLSWVDSASQRELLRLLALFDAAGTPILQVGRREATLEEVFVQLTDGRGWPA